MTQLIVNGHDDAQHRGLPPKSSPQDLPVETRIQPAATPGTPSACGADASMHDGGMAARKLLQHGVVHEAKGLAAQLFGRGRRKIGAMIHRLLLSLFLEHGRGISDPAVMKHPRAGMSQPFLRTALEIRLGTTHLTADGIAA